ncbi:hypothetical protein PUNSTDRAFT_138327 [Punctularia strigosozonata HHB-11173 SS5]|uniref:Uncharacterized protein n=1 Tax=Punctularia strigosozonata (strain HHB-11173) TaxID=741275 RepID=R7S4F2_PUNST|nr:uncharacterized protein PUNSTDRAFT_138327 [Punctularia strigosozonata HHB-11173 SS5]EIN04682.1 hypothetical protein PUNSTDRAFT_138327 [Punctularia strigosozonata HHB-11173 SS5]
MDGLTYFNLDGDKPAFSPVHAAIQQAPDFHIMCNPLCKLLNHLHHHASHMEGETFELEVVLIEATQRRQELVGRKTSRPIFFGAEGAFVHLGPQGWVLAKRYKEVLTLVKRTKEVGLTATKSEADWMPGWSYNVTDEDM